MEDSFALAADIGDGVEIAFGMLMHAAAQLRQHSGAIAEELPSSLEALHETLGASTPARPESPGDPTGGTSGEL